MFHTGILLSFSHFFVLCFELISLSRGGSKIIWIAPSGGRDRPDAVTGEWYPVSFYLWHGTTNNTPVAFCSNLMHFSGWFFCWFSCFFYTGLCDVVSFRIIYSDFLLGCFSATFCSGSSNKFYLIEIFSFSCLFSGFFYVRCINLFLSFMLYSFL